MADVFKFLSTARSEIILIVAGVLFVFPAVFSVTDITKLNVSPRWPPALLPLVIGIVLIMLGATRGLGRFGPPTDSAEPRGGRITESDSSITARIGESHLRVIAGRLERTVADPSMSLVVLPANECFDDDCINDPQSALGAFVLNKFPGRAREFERMIAAALGSSPSEYPSNQITVGGQLKQRYGLGTAVYLDHPLSETLHLLVVAASVQSATGGLRGDVPSLFAIAQKAATAARNHRLRAIYLPVIGAGHGGITREYALLAQLLAWTEILGSNPGQKISVNIVVFRQDDSATPDIPLDQAKRLLKVAISVGGVSGET